MGMKVNEQTWFHDVLFVSHFNVKFFMAMYVCCLLVAKDSYLILECGLKLYSTL
jgi:hypothetical protein